MGGGDVRAGVKGARPCTGTAAQSQRSIGATVTGRDGSETTVQMWHFSTEKSACSGASCSAAAQIATGCDACAVARPHVWNVVTTATASTQNSRKKAAARRRAGKLPRFNTISVNANALGRSMPVRVLEVARIVIRSHAVKGRRS